MIYSKGISWIGDCRIPFVDEKEKEGVCKSDKTIVKDSDMFKGRYEYKRGGGNTQGRFTPNLLCCDDVLNDGSVSKSGDNKIRKSDGFNKNAYGIGIGVKAGDNNGEYGDKGSNSRYYNLDLWFNQLLNKLS